LPRDVFFFGFAFDEPPANLAAAFFAVFSAGISTLLAPEVLPKIAK
jgi:hypothetical protein